MARLIERYKEKPNLIAFMSIYPQKLQELESAVHGFVQGKWVDDAEGVQLDKLGFMVGAPRRGYDDDLYRLLIKVQIKINCAEGRAEDLIDIYRDLTSSSLVVYINHGIAAVSLLGNGNDPFNDNELFYELLERCAPGGVSVNLLGLVVSPRLAFHPATNGAGANVGKFPRMLRPPVNTPVATDPTTGLYGHLVGVYTPGLYLVTGNCVVDAGTIAIFLSGAILQFTGPFSITILGAMMLADTSAIPRITLGSDDAVLIII
jgi:hypothetical protein